MKKGRDNKMLNKIRPMAYSLITALSFAVIILIILFSNESSQIDIKSGDVSDTDIYATRATGFAILASSSALETRS